MEDTPLRILLVDDDEDDYVVARDLLAEIGSGWCELEWHATYEGGLEAMRSGRHDVFLVDYRLGERTGLELLRAARADGCTVPFIFLTGTGDHQIDVEAMQAGAADYLDKGRIDAALLERSVRYAVERARHRRARESAEAERDARLVVVSRSHEDMLAILNQLRLGIVMTDRDGRVCFQNQACRRLLGRTHDPVDMPWEQLCPFDDEDKLRVKAMLDLPPERRERISVHMEAPDGQHYWMDIEVQDDPREPQRKIFILYDMTTVHDLRRQLDEKARFQDLVGKSEPMRRVYQHIIELAKVDSTVLIEGDTGTGKELVARAIHTSSQRKDQPFIAVNCAGLSDSLLGSQLFGHKRGAFTGAVEDQVGVFETASGGTIFLDEIGDISQTVQTSLLRVLQEKEITRLGDVHPRKVDVRVIAATHRDLNREVEAGRFRMDLLYRVRVARVQLPTLRERRVDIPLLAETFLRKLRATTGKHVEGLSEDALGLLLNHSWPGNVRELQSAIECAMIRCRGAVIQPDDLPPEVAGQGFVVSTGMIDVQHHERQRIMSALETAHGSRSKAARLLGISRSTLYRRLAELELEVD